MNLVRFTKCRNVRTPLRAHHGDAGVDFFMPIDLNLKDIHHYENCTFRCSNDNTIHEIDIMPHGRVLIPSGIRVLIEPEESMLMVANKSGLAAKNGIIYSSQIVDSPYTGEIHLGIINTSDINSFRLEASNKVVQLIHVPIILSEWDEINLDHYEDIAQCWGSRGSNGIGSDHIETQKL